MAVVAYKQLSLRRTAERMREEEDPWLCVREFLDDFYAADGAGRVRMILERPERVGDPRFDAYLGALAEHMALHYGLPVPSWAAEPGRFLDRWWFPTTFKSLHAIALVQSPASFRRRGIFVDDTELKRC
ncbi:MAG: hypothetical protein HYR98_09810 [Nitrospirae bacterium]|nr:hypothetical protein [Nitrospirota bacterium]MBI3392782.1 hypothetical protein [Nitrospirota bacterium]